MKIRSVGAGSFYADRLTDGRTDMTKLIVAFRNFSKAPKIEGYNVCLQCYYHFNCRYMNTNVSLTRADVAFVLL